MVEILSFVFFVLPEKIYWGKQHLEVGGQEKKLKGERVNPNSFYYLLNFDFFTFLICNQHAAGHGISIILLKMLAATLLADYTQQFYYENS